MHQKTIRKIGYSEYVTLPQEILKSLKIKTGTILNIEQMNGKIVMTPIAQQVITPIANQGGE